MKYGIPYIIALLFMALFSACSTQDNSITETNISTQDYYTIDTNVSTHKIIFDDDALGDNDIAQSLSSILALEKTGNVHLLGVALSGVDTNNKRSLAVSSILYYYGREDVPVSISKRKDTRVQPSPFSNYPKLSDLYVGQGRDVSEFNNDGIFDAQREDAIDMYCRVLSSVEHKVTIVVAGNCYNIDELFKETTRCHGIELVRDKVDKLVLVGGLVNKKGWDMNFGAFGRFHPAAVKAAKNTINISPVPVVLIDEAAGCYPTDVYRQYQTNKTDSPMAMILSAMYGSHAKIEDRDCVWDAAAALYAISGTEWYKNKIWTEVHGKIKLDRDGRVSFHEDTSSKDIKLQRSSSTGQILNDIFIDLVKL